MLRLEAGDVGGVAEGEQVADLLKPMSTPSSSANRRNAAQAAVPSAMLAGSENWARTPPSGLPEDPPASSSASSRV